MKVLLIGGTGIISSDIKELCLEKEYEVYILNRGLNKVKNTNKKVHTIICDIRDKENAKNKLKDYYFDVVVDFISYNVAQMENTIDIIKDICKQYFFISSATVYAKSGKDIRITEDYKKSNELWDYAKNKLECENKLIADNSKYKFFYTIIRPYITYSDARIPFVIISHDKHWSLVNRIKNNKPILICDDGNICTLTYSKDFAVGMVGLFNNEKAFNEDFHITTDFNLTWTDAIKCIAKEINKEAIIEYLPSNTIIKHMPEIKGVLLGDKSLDRLFDNSKIKNAVPDFNASTKFEEGIKNVIRFYENNSFMRDIDISWDARIDRVINKEVKTKYNNLSNCYKGKDKIVYFLCYYNLTYPLYKLGEKVIRKFKYIAKKKKVK